MENYISLNGVKTVLSEEQVRSIAESLKIESSKKLRECQPGENFKIGVYEFIVLEHIGDTTAVILKDLWKSSETFGSNNNYNGSNVDKICNEFGEKIGEIIGEDNLVEHTIDLTSDDGLKDYGIARRKASLITANQYRKWVHIFDKHKIDKWWWLSTAYSTPTHDDNVWVKCVSPSGIIDYYDYGNYYGVRPFCILNSYISIS